MAFRNYILCFALVAGTIAGTEPALISMDYSYAYTQTWNNFILAETYIFKLKLKHWNIIAY